MRSETNTISRIALTLMMLALRSLTGPDHVRAQPSDFNGDGYSDLAVGVPGEGFRDRDNAGGVNVIYGSPDGPSPAGDQFWHQSIEGVLNRSEKNDAFGMSLAAGDFNGDGCDDLAIGVPGERLGGVKGGAVNVLYGSSERLTADNDQLWHQDVLGVEGEMEPGDNFGSSLVACDFNGDGYDDLAVGVSVESIGTASWAGAVHVFYGSSGGLAVKYNQMWHQNFPEMNGVAEEGDNFGSALAAGYFDDDGYCDLAIGIPGETLEGVAGGREAGAVQIIYGTVIGLKAYGNQLWHRNSDGIEGSANWSGWFGASLAAGDFDNDGHDDLAVGVPGDEVDGELSAGGVNVLYGSPSGLGETGGQYFHQNTVGMTSNRAEAYDSFGKTLTTGDFNDDGYSDLAIGVPSERMRGIRWAGAVHVLYGTASGLDPLSDQFWFQGTEGINGKVEEGDFFGRALGSGDYNGDGRSDLVVGVPYESIDGKSRAGALNLIWGSPLGLYSYGDRVIHQNTQGIRNTVEADDTFGFSLVR